MATTTAAAEASAPITSPEEPGEGMTTATTSEEEEEEGQTGEEINRIDGNDTPAPLHLFSGDDGDDERNRETPVPSKQQSESGNAPSEPSFTIITEPPPPPPSEQPRSDETDDNDNDDDDDEILQQQQEQHAQFQKRAMELNDAYQALEKMRRFNLEVACQDCGIPPPPPLQDWEENDDSTTTTTPITFEAEECTACWLQGVTQRRDASWRGKVYHWTKVKSHKVNNSQYLKPLKKLAEHREQTRRRKCLTCATPCCARHVSGAFQREGLTVCLECEQVFSLDFLLDSVVVHPTTTTEEEEMAGQENRSSNNNNSNLHHPPPSTRQQRQARMDRLLELYDRALLLLEFSRPFLPQAIEVLENTKHRDNHINFGGSTVGIVSGILGVAAAATIVTPAGVPLLIVSLLLGGAATGAQTGTEVHSKFFSEPKQLANRIMALHGMALSILNLVRVLRDVVTQDHVQLNAWQGEEEPEVYGLTTNASSDSLHSPSGSNNNSNNNGSSPSKIPVQLATKPSSSSSLGASSQLGIVVLPEKASMARSVRQMSRSMSGTLRGLQPMAVAGGVLAGATIVLEAKNMAVTLAAIRDGSPCDKAQALREIQAELEARDTTTKGGDKKKTKEENSEEENDVPNETEDDEPTQQKRELQGQQDKIPPIRLVDTATLDQECCAYLAYLEERRLDKKQVLDLLEQATKAAQAKAAADRPKLSMREQWSSFSQKHFRKNAPASQGSNTLPTLNEVDPGNESDSSSNVTHSPLTDDDHEGQPEAAAAAAASPLSSWRNRLSPRNATMTSQRRRRLSEEQDNCDLPSSPSSSWISRLPARRRTSSSGSAGSLGSHDKKKRSAFSWPKKNRGDWNDDHSSSHNFDDSETGDLLIVEETTAASAANVSWRDRMQRFQSQRRQRTGATT